jgi:hypothetical protein
MKFARHLRKKAPRPITNRRLRAAERRLEKDRTKFPLLSNWIAECQPTAIERLEKFQIAELERVCRKRQLTAKKWRESRALLRTLPYLQRQEIIKEWNNSGFPKTVEYFGDFLTSKIPGERERKHQELLESAKKAHLEKLEKLGYKPRN